MGKVRDTSLLNYVTLEDNGILKERELEIFEFLKKHPDCTDWEITEALGYTDRNSISPARTRLFNKGILIDDGKRNCTITTRKAYQWRINENRA